MNRTRPSSFIQPTPHPCKTSATGLDISVQTRIELNMSNLMLEKGRKDYASEIFLATVHQNPADHLMALHAAAQATVASIGNGQRVGRSSK